METNKEDWEVKWYDFIDNSGKVNYLLENEDEAIKDFIKSLLETQEAKIRKEYEGN